MRRASSLTLSIGTLVTLAASIGGGCATAVDSAGTGGSTTASTATGTGATGGGSATASSSTGVIGPCVFAGECPPTGDPCTEPVCINGECKKSPINDGASCDDGNYCTENDSCLQGVCTGGTMKYCPPPDTCHIGVCDPATKSCAAQPGNDGAQCDDDDPCTGWGLCSNGTCSKGSPVDCSFLDGECSVGVCDPMVGCKTMALNDGAPCNDNLFCTIDDQCMAGTCSGAPNPCAPPENPCLIGVCNEISKSCVTTPGNEGMACQDGNDCTSGEKCQAGQCVGGVPSNDGMPCNDKDGCTQGTTCAGGVCGGATSTIDQCTSGDSCCPPGCLQAQDGDCLYWASGVQQNVPNASLVGWSQCWLGTYNDDLGSAPVLSTLLQQCNKSKLLMACRPTGAASWKLVAMAPRADVLFDCSSQTNCTKQSNGVGWYYSDSYSWGFAQGGDSVQRTSCDYNPGNETNPDLRLCWHSGGGSINTGFRCGDNSSEPTFWLNNSTTWERALFHAD